MERATNDAMSNYKPRRTGNKNCIYKQFFSLQTVMTEGQSIMNGQYKTCKCIR